MENREQLEHNIFKEDFLLHSYPEFFEKGDYLFESELEPNGEYYMVGYLQVENKLEALFDTDELIILSDDILEIDDEELEGGILW